MYRAGLLALLTCSVAACDRGDPLASERVKPIYSRATGVLQQLDYDANGDGITDTRTFMQGLRAVRSEIDRDQDGVVERWEYYRDDGGLEKVGSSSRRDGIVDTWTYPGPGGVIDRIEVSTRRDGTVSRWERYGDGVLARIEEDASGDGRIDRWEAYDGDGVLVELALDTTRERGRPDRRLIYGAGGVARIEVDPDGDGVFTPVAVEP